MLSFNFVCVYINMATSAFLWLVFPGNIPPLFIGIPVSPHILASGVSIFIQLILRFHVLFHSPLKFQLAALLLLSFTICFGFGFGPWRFHLVQPQKYIQIMCPVLIYLVHKCNI